jgi:hypothetical protein
MKAFNNETIVQEFQRFHTTGSTELSFNSALAIGICEVTAPYIPMVEFMETFNTATRMIREHGLRHLIFDKRSLRTFHQPSMEWYFVEWKPVVRDLGMADHYKILPDEPWFHRCVEAGRNDILSNYPEQMLNGISIVYVRSLEEAINAVALKEKRLTV